MPIILMSRDIINTNCKHQTWLAKVGLTKLRSIKLVSGRAALKVSARASVNTQISPEEQ